MRPDFLKNVFTRNIIVSFLRVIPRANNNNHNNNDNLYCARSQPLNHQVLYMFSYNYVYSYEWFLYMC